MTPYKEFTARFKLLIGKNPNLITTTLSNIFTMRLIGNKTHGDLAEIAIAEFINQYMYDFRSIHVGKDLYRAKEHEEDITIINEITKEEFPVSLKAYGDGPLQLSTDKNFLLFPALEAMGKIIEGKDAIAKVWESPVFEDFTDKNVLPLIYHEKNKNVISWFSTMRKQRSRLQKLFLKRRLAKASVRRKRVKGAFTLCIDFMIKMESMYLKFDTVAELPTPCKGVFGLIRGMGSNTSIVLLMAGLHIRTTHF